MSTSSTVTAVTPVTTVAVIDYGMGNLHSVAKALEHANTHAKVLVTSDKQQIADADHLHCKGDRSACQQSVPPHRE